MAYRLSPQAEGDLEDIAFYIFLESGSLEIADRLIESITERFDVLDAHPRAGGVATICGRAYAGFRSASTSSCIAKKARMW